MTAQRSDGKAMAEPSISLYKVKGATSVEIRVSLKDGGDVVVEGYDTGEAPERQFGSTDYEYLVHVGGREKDKLLAALVCAAGQGERGRSLSPLPGWVRALMPARGLSEEDLDGALQSLSEAARAAAGGLDLAAKDKLLLALIRERYGGEPRAVSLFSEFCYDSGVRAEFRSWNSG